jgi:AraC-like DNA-binding protein
MASGVLSHHFGFAGHLQALTPSNEGVFPAHVHAEIELNLVLEHGLTYLFAGRAVHFPAGRWLAYWAAMPHRVLTVPRPSALAWITVPIATFLTWSSPRLASRLLGGEIVLEPCERPGSRQQASDWISAVQVGSGEPQRRIACLEIEALLRRLDLDGVALERRERPAVAAETARQPAYDDAPLAPQAVEAVEAMCGWLAESYQEAVAVADCARAVGMHPSYAMTVFRRTCGMTIWQYLTRLRLAHAQRLLLTTDQDVLSIALAAGFGSQARFYVAFKRAFRTTPAAFRRSQLG